MAFTGKPTQVSASVVWDGSKYVGEVIEEFFFSNADKVVQLTGSLQTSGSLLVKSGITGALNVLPDGSPFLVAGSDISLSTGSNGQITIASTATSADVYWQSTANKTIFTTGSVEASGSLLVKSGITGALNVLPDGNPFLAAGTNITLSTGSNGQITINSTATGDSFFFSNTEDVVESTGSLEITGSVKVSGTLDQFGGVKWNTLVVTGNVTLATSQYMVGVSASSSPTITLPSSPARGQAFIVKDIAGNAASANIIVSSSNEQIDGASTYTIAIDYGSNQFVFFGTDWAIV